MTVRGDNNNDAEDMPTAGNKRLVKGDMAPKRISHLQFGIISPTEMQRLAEFQVSSRELFSMPSRKPAAGGCLDPRLGVSDKLSVCATCHRKLQDCAGHFGYIKLALPVFHIGFFRHTLHLLQCICKSCSRVLLDEPERRRQLSKMRHFPTDALGKAAIFRKLVETCKKCKYCPHCHQFNGTVKKITGAPALRIVHERYKDKTGRIVTDEYEHLVGNLEVAAHANKDLDHILHGSSSSGGGGSSPTVPYEDLVPTRVLDLFTRIPDEGLRDIVDRSHDWPTGTLDIATLVGTARADPAIRRHGCGWGQQ